MVAKVNEYYRVFHTTKEEFTGPNFKTHKETFIFLLGLLNETNYQYVPERVGV